MSNTVSSKDDDSRTEDTNATITLALSGGGFRATMFHLGLIRYLREVGRLKDVVEVFSVSGGSVLAAHLALRWSDYVTGDESQFKSAAAELVRFVQSGVRERIFRNITVYLLALIAFMLLTATLVYRILNMTGWWALLPMCIALLAVLLVAWIFEERVRPITLLKRNYDRLFNNAKLESIAERQSKFFVLATNLTTGNIACFTNSGVYINVSKGGGGKEIIPTSSLELSECVAASSAFPPVFSPYPLTRKRVRADSASLQHTQYMTDGGVYDNLGIRACKILSTNNGLVVLSDAERRFDWSTGSTFRWLIGRASRATDVLMNRVVNLEFELLKKTVDNSGLDAKFTKVATVRLQEDFVATGQAHKTINTELMRQARRIRTDLDSFSDIEVQLLFSAGYLAAKKSFEGTADFGPGVTFSQNAAIPAGYEPGRWLPIGDLHVSNEVNQQLDKSEKPQIKLFGPHGLLGWLGVVLLTIVLVGNPFSVALLQLIPLSPLPFKGQKIVHVDDMPAKYSMMASFLPANQKLPDGVSSIEYRLVFSDYLSNASLTLRPSDFDFELEPPRGFTLHFHQAFVFYEESESLHSLEQLDKQKIRYRVSNPRRTGKIAMLMAFSRREGDDEEFTANDFLFNTRVK